MVSWAGKSELLKDVFWAIGKIAGGILDVISWIGDKIQWVFDNIIKPILDVVDIFYSTTKKLFGGGKTEVVISAAASPTTPYSPTEARNQPQVYGWPGLAMQSGYVPGASPAGIVSPLSLNSDRSSKITSADLLTGGKGAKSKSENINSGGQRSIIINIGKQVERLEVHVAGVKEGADEIANVVREQLRKVMYSLNGVATS
jgi:hypothetical protein